MTSPVSGLSLPVSSRSRVVLPAPFSPRTTTRLPRSMARSTSVNTSSLPYDFERPRAVSGVRPEGAGVGEPELGAPVTPAGVLEAREQPLGPPRHVLGGGRL